MQADVLTKIILPSALFLIMFGIGLSLKPSGFMAVFREPRAAIIGLGAQMLALPILAFLAAIVFRLPPEIAVGIQNGTLALFVAGTLIGNEVMMIPAVTYSLIMLVSGGAFGLWVRNRNIAPGSVSPGPVQRPGSSRFGP